MAPPTASSSDLSKVTAKWKKRVNLEYARLRQQKRFRHQDDMRTAWRANKQQKDAAIAAKEVQPEVEEAADGDGDGDEGPAAKRAEPVW